MKHLLVHGMALLVAVFATASESITIDLPIKAPLNLPSRLAEQPRQVAFPDGTGYTVFSLLPIVEGDSLFITVVFKENGKEGPALFWTNQVSGQQTTISKDLAEGVVGLNQRTVAIPPSLANTTSRIILTGEQSKVLRVRLDWVQATPTFVAADQAPVSFIAGDHLQAPSELTGVTPEGLPDTWFGSVLDAPLQEKAESIEGSLEFDVSVTSEVSQVLLRAKFLGLPLDQSVTIWANGQLAGTVQPTVPPLTDVGYIEDAQGGISYAGWRSGAILLPATLFKNGENSIQIESKTSGVFIRDATLQLRASPSIPPVAPAENSSSQESQILSN